MGFRLIEGDEHFGHIGFGELVEASGGTFGAGILPAIAEPDLIIKIGDGRKNVLAIDIRDVIVWDNREWDYWTDIVPDFSGGENLLQSMQTGITKDNSVEGNQAPTADTAAQGTRPGGSATVVAGLATGGPGNRLGGDEQPTRFVDRVMFFGSADEEQTAVGQITTPYNKVERTMYTPYEADGNTAHYLMTAAHYHLWIEAEGFATAAGVSLGADVRRTSVDLKELMFDRAVLLSILDALVVSS